MRRQRYLNTFMAESCSAATKGVDKSDLHKMISTSMSTNGFAIDIIVSNTGIESVDISNGGLRYV